MLFRSDVLQKHIDSFFNPNEASQVPPHAEEAPVETPHSSTGVLPDHAIAIRTVGQNFQAVVVAYNAETKEAKVESVEEVGTYKRDATIKFKVLADKYRFI